MHDESWFNCRRGIRGFPFCCGVGLTQPATGGALLVKSDRDAGVVPLSGYTASRHAIQLSSNHRRYHLFPLGMFVLYLLQWLSQAVEPLAPPSQYTRCLSGRKSFSPWQRPLFWIRRNSTASSSVDNSVTIQLHASNLIMFVRRGAGCGDETQGVLKQTRAALYCVIEFQCIGLSLCTGYAYFLNE
jgi:hypothetical protein